MQGKHGDERIYLFCICLIPRFIFDQGFFQQSNPGNSVAQECNPMWAEYCFWRQRIFSIITSKSDICRNHLILSLNQTLKRAKVGDLNAKTWIFGSSDWNFSPTLSLFFCIKGRICERERARTINQWLKRTRLPLPLLPTNVLPISTQSFGRRMEKYIGKKLFCSQQI